MTRIKIGPKTFRDYFLQEVPMIAQTLQRVIMENDAYYGGSQDFQYIFNAIFGIFPVLIPNLESFSAHGFLFDNR